MGSQTWGLHKVVGNYATCDDHQKGNQLPLNKLNSAENLARMYMGLWRKMIDLHQALLNIADGTASMLLISQWDSSNEQVRRILYAISLSNLLNPFFMKTGTLPYRTISCVEVVWIVHWQMCESALILIEKEKEASITSATIRGWVFARKELCCRNSQCQSSHILRPYYGKVSSLTRAKLLGIQTSVHHAFTVAPATIAIVG